MSANTECGDMIFNSHSFSYNTCYCMMKGSEIVCKSDGKYMFTLSSEETPVDRKCPAIIGKLYL